MIAVPPTAIETFVPAVPKIPVFATLVGLIAHVVTEEAPVTDTGPDDEKPPLPPTYPPIPEVVTDIPAANTKPAADIVDLKTPAVAILIAPAAEEKMPSVKRFPIAIAGKAAVPREEDNNLPFAILTFEFSTRIASEFVIVTFVPAKGEFCIQRVAQFAYVCVNTVDE